MKRFAVAAPKDDGTGRVAKTADPTQIRIVRLRDIYNSLLNTKSIQDILELEYDQMVDKGLL